jgi:hypothetical protein
MVLGFSPHLPVSVCGTGTILLLEAFLGSVKSDTSLLYSLPITPQLIYADLPAYIPQCLDTHPIVCTSYPSASLHRK